MTPFLYSFIVDLRLDDQRMHALDSCFDFNDINDVAVDAERFAQICKALAHPVRVRIVEHLKAMDRCICGQIVEILPLAQSTVSQHLKILKASGLVQGSVEGPCTCYCLDRAVLDEFIKMADRFGRGSVSYE